MGFRARLCAICVRRGSPSAFGRVWTAMALPRIAIHLGLNFTHHDPAEDAFACAHIVLRGCEQLKVETIEDLARRTGILLGRMSPDHFEKCRLIPWPEL